MLEDIFTTTGQVLLTSEQVSINVPKLKEHAQTIQKSNLAHWTDKGPVNLDSLSQEQKLAFTFLFDTISFSYWGDPKWRIDYHGKPLDGSWAMMASLGRAIEEEKDILNPEYLQNMSLIEFKNILRGNIEIPLLEERLTLLKDLGENVQNKYQGKFTNIVEASDLDTEKMFNIISQDLPGYNDFAYSRGLKVHFYKRAQLLTADIDHIMKSEAGLKGIDKLSACADYKIPQVLRRFGILEYSPHLSKVIDSRSRIRSGSREEIEIRANTIWAVRWTKDEVQERIPDITDMDINDYFWLAGQTKSPLDRPYHQTRTIAY